MTRHQRGRATRPVAGAGGSLRRRGEGGRRRLAAAVAAASLAALSFLAVPALPAAGSSPRSAASPSLAIVVAAPRVPDGSSYLGPMATSSTLSGDVALRPRDPSALARFIAAVSNPRSPEYGHYLARGEFASAFGPTPAAIAAVGRTLSSEGLRLTGVSGNGLLVGFTGTTAHVEHAFHVSIDRYRLAGGSLGYATTSAVELPAAIAPYVTAVVGLDDLVHFQSSLRQAPRTHRPSPETGPPAPEAKGAPAACSAAVAQEAYGGVTDDALAHSYGVDGLYSSGDLGQHETIDIFELEPFSYSDIKQFDECYFHADHTDQVKRVAVDGGTGVGEGSGEAALDIEDVSAIAPDADVEVYEAPNSNAGSLDNYNAMIVADTARVISSSWGLCEGGLQLGAPGTQAVESSIFMQAAAQGQTVFGPAGDAGSDDCAIGDTPAPQYLSVDDPASQPYVVGVGGTTFTDTDEPPGEIVWNDGNEFGGGGGGISETWAMPTWQLDSGTPGVANNSYITNAADQYCSNDPTGLADIAHPPDVPTALPAHTMCREVPDVTALADQFTGITVYLGGWTTFGGTSSSTPLWAAMTADIDASSYCAASPARTVGFLSPLLYSIAANPTTYAEAFNDIRTGDNDDMGEVGNTYPAGPDYDMASGLGSPRITDPDGKPGLAELACDAADPATRPGVSTVSPDYGPTSGGTTVTIAGAGFGSSRGEVHFGDADATVDSWAAGSITVTAPPFYAPEATSAPAGGPADVTVETTAAGGLPARSTAPDAESVFHYLAPPASQGGSDLPLVGYVGPTGGPVAGGTSVHVIGSGFEDGSLVEVSFGGSMVPADDVTVVSDSELTLRTPAAPASCGATDGSDGACQVEVVVTTTLGSSPTSTILPAYEGPFSLGPAGNFNPPPGCDCEVAAAATEYDYAPTPTISNISPAFGDANGGSLETITGSGFNILTYQWTNFGPSNDNDDQDLNLVSITPDVIQIDDLASPDQVSTLPSSSPVSIQTEAGLASTGGFSYAGVPAVTGLSTSYGPTTGGQSLTIRGAGFGDATQVDFLSQYQPGNIGASVVYLSSPPAAGSTLTVDTPADVPTVTDVEVCSATGCSQADPRVDTYIYDYPGQPVVTSASPASGPAQGDTVVTIHGDLLAGVRAVYFGKQLAAGWSNGPGFLPSGSSIEIYAKAPPGTARQRVDITVTTYGSGSASVDDPSATFAYLHSTPSAPLPITHRDVRGSVEVSWSAPASDGGSPVTSYTVVAATPGRAGVTARGVTAGTRMYGFDYLQPGVPWTFTVYAESALGQGLPARSAAVTLAPAGNGYLVATSDGAVFGFGALSSSGGPGGGKLASPIVGLAATPDGLGYFEAAADGTVYHLGDAGFYGSAAVAGSTKVVGIAATPDGKGYWLVTNSGDVYAYGDAHYDGAVKGATDVVGIASSPDGLGYFVDQADGAVEGFGNAVVRGDMLGKHLNKPLVGVEADPANGGYWLVGGDGGVFAFGGAPYLGSMIGKHLNEGAVGMVASPDGKGYWLVAGDGGVFSFGDTRYLGNPFGEAQSPSVGIATSP